MRIPPIVAVTLGLAACRSGPSRPGPLPPLEASGAQPLLLHCTHRTLEVAAAGARPRADPIAPCERRGWDPPATTPTQVLVCSAAGQDASDADPDDQLVFGPGPGVEWVDENDGCATRAGGLRAAG